MASFFEKITCEKCKAEEWYDVAGFLIGYTECKCNKSFQSESKKSGDEFENLVLIDLKNRGFDMIDKNIYIDGTGCEVDFIAYGNCNEHVEAKGGKDDINKRPGAQRTDNVKKAIANGSLIKSKYPETYYVVYFSAKPIPQSYSDQMIRLALSSKIIDEVRYIESKIDIESMPTLF